MPHSECGGGRPPCQRSEVGRSKRIVKQLVIAEHPTKRGQLALRLDSVERAIANLSFVVSMPVPNQRQD